MNDCEKAEVKGGESHLQVDWIMLMARFFHFEWILTYNHCTVYYVWSTVKLNEHFWTATTWLQGPFWVGFRVYTCKGSTEILV